MALVLELANQVDSDMLTYLQKVGGSSPSERAG